MSMHAAFLLVLALLEMGLAVLIWHRAVPRLLSARGRQSSICTWLLGMVLAIDGGIVLIAAFAGAGPDTLQIARSLALIAYAGCRYRVAVALCDANWTNFQLHGSRTCSKNGSPS